MHKFWVGSSITLAIVLAAILGAWAGAVYHPPFVVGNSAPSVPSKIAASESSASPKLSQAGDKKVLYYWDPMLGPPSISQKPGISAMGMELVPVYANQANGGPTVTIDPAVVQNMGVQTAEARKGPLVKTVRTVGNLEVPETGLYDITLKVSGYIDKLYADQTGMHLHKGDPLFDLYSPDLVVAEDELIAARKSVDTLSGASAEVRMQAQSLVESARRKLRLLDIPDAMIDTIAKQDHAPKDITIRSPAEGVLEDKMIVQGSSVQAGMKLMRIEDHRTMWLEAQAYEEQLPRVKLGDMADATLDALPGKTFSGKIIFINPHLNHMTRTIDVRVALDNPQFVLKPGMYATVLIHSKPVDDAILVPREAVIDTGTRKIAFIAEGDGHFSPRLVTTGLTGDHDEVQILSGLAPGETVVTSGQFLMDVESRTEEAIEKMRTPVQPPQTEPSNTMPATTTFGGAATGAAETGPGTSTGRLDAVTRTYLTVVDYLQADHTDNKPVDIAKLLDAAQQLVKEVPADPENQRANTLLNAVSAMKDQSLDAQRKRFETVSSAMVGLIDIDPPSKAVAATLYVVHCPMKNADWLQTQRAVNNPFLATMRTCGTVSRTISLMPTK